MINELEEIKQRVEREERLKDHDGLDRVILAQDKLLELEALAVDRPSFRVTTDMPSIDECADGFRLGQLIVVSGPPKNGKTLLCQNFSERFTDQEKKCLWFSYELGYEEFLKKFTKIPLNFYLPNQLASRNLEWVEDRIIESKLKYGTEIVFIDHLDFLRDPKDLRKNVSINMASYVGSIVQEVKSMAVRHNVLIFLMCHITKGKWTTNELPNSEDVRDSGQITQLADMVMMVIRKRAPKGSKEVYDATEAIVGVIENRHNGKTIKTTVQLTNGQFKEDLYFREEPVDEEVSARW